MVFIASVIYPTKPDTKFDMDYYLKTHMPLVGSLWGQYGLKKWEVVQFTIGKGGSEPEFRVQALLTFESGDQVQAALGAAAAKEIFDDVPKFTDISPVLTAGDLVGSANV